MTDQGQVVYYAAMADIDGDLSLGKNLLRRYYFNNNNYHSCYVWYMEWLLRNPVRLLYKIFLNCNLLSSQL